VSGAEAHTDKLNLLFPLCDEIEKSSDAGFSITAHGPKLQEAAQLFRPTPPRSVPCGTAIGVRLTNFAELKWALTLD
jgi:hypothetical protein